MAGNKIDFRILEGTPIWNFEKSVTVQAFLQNRDLREERGLEVYGFAYISSAMVIRDEEGKPIGALSAVCLNDKFDTLRTGAEELSAVVEEMSANTDQISQGSNEIASELQELSVSSNLITEDIVKIEKMLAFVKEVADQSNLLGLNAAIESARAGEHGRGFSIVADEIRKMAEKSKAASQDIKSQLDHIQKAIFQMNDAIHRMSATTQQHSASLQELNSAFLHIVKTADKIANVAN